MSIALILALLGAFVAPRWLVPSGGGPSGNPDDSPGGPVLDKGTLPAHMGRSWKDIDNPSADGWETEVFSEQADKILKELGKLLTQPEEIEPSRVAPLVAGDFDCGDLLPPRRSQVYADRLLTVERAPSGGEGSGQQAGHRGAAGLAATMQALAEPLRQAQDARFKFKLFRVTPSGDRVETRQYLALSGRTETGLWEQNATWVIRWRPGNSPDDSPRMESITVADFEQVVSRHAPGPLFADCTGAVLGKAPCYREQFLRGMNHWFERIQDTRYFAVFGNPGLATGDVNGDGLDDLYVCQEWGLPNRLFLQHSDGTVREVAEEWGVNWLENCRSALLVDLDNDGRQDLVVATVGHVVVASNEGNRFQVRAVLRCDDDTMSLAAADYDGDGDLDLYVCVYFRTDDLEEPRSRLMAGVAGSGRAYDSGGGRNALFRNDLGTGGALRFTDVTKPAGLEVNNDRHSFAACWEDFDNDGHLDLYVANDYGRNNLYRNNGNGTFTDITAQTGAEDTGFGMSASWGDYDQDGWMDVYVGNMFSAAGNRVTFQDRFQSSSPLLRQRFQRFARGNTLMRNRGNGTFEDVSEPAAVTLGRWAWGSNFVDVNNDGREDLVVANGFITTEDTGDL